MHDALLEFTDKVRVAYVIMGVCQRFMRIALIVAGVSGTVTLSTLTVLFSNMDAPGVVLSLGERVVQFYLVFFLSSALAAYLYLLSISYSLKTRVKGTDVLAQSVTDSDTANAVKQFTWLMAPVAFGAGLWIFTTYVFGVPKPSVEYIRGYVCQSVYHTLATNPDYPLPARVEALDCELPRASPANGEASK